MAWTYSGDPSSSKLDEVRFLLGDVVQSPQSLTDAEVQYLLDKNEDDARHAAAESANRVAVRYLEKSVTSKKVGDLTLAYDYGQTYERYMNLALTLADSTATAGNAIKAPIMLDDSDNVFSIGMGDNPARQERYL